MSLATSEPRELKFLTRFEHIWTSLRRYQVREGLGWSFLVGALGLAVLAAVDYRLELPWNVRAAGLAGVLVAALGVLWARVIAPLRWWTQRRTAAEIESRFPQLGQRIRTVVQYAGLPEPILQSEGVTPSLVVALEEDTEIQAEPLPLDRIVPWRRVWAVAVLAALPALILIVAAAMDLEWRIALQRALLSRRAYTTLNVAPGNLTVEQGDNVPIIVELAGRLKRDVVLFTRPEGQPDSPWKAADLGIPDGGSASKRESKLEKVREPLSYRVVAGPASSPTYRIGVRYPLALKSFDVKLAPPAYTRIKPSTVKGGDLRVVEGTNATFQIAFDSPPAKASLVVTDPSIRSKKDKPAPAPQVIPLVPDVGSNSNTHTAGLTLTKGLTYQIEAITPDGRALPKKGYKIEVFEDRPPRVTFEQPDEALEVHPIAEILNRIRVGDDFGLTRAGIVFQYNNGDEQTLILKDFRKDGTEPVTTAALQEMLMLEKLAASPTDSLTYYAFAEDNYPAGARRTESDLRYIDIRPFKREYKLADSADAGFEGEDEFATLAELIARQRFNLNRANRLAKHKPGAKTIAEDPLKIAGFEETLVQMTREFTEGVEGIVGQRVEPLHAAEESMLAAVAALDHGQNAQAPGHMGDALRHLIAARITLQILIGQDPQASQKVRRFDRQQAQKIRKPKKDQEEAEEIAEQIEELAQEEDFVYATLSGLQMEQEAKAGKAGKPAETDQDAEEKKPEPAKKEAEEPKKQQGSTGAGSKGEGRGPKGEKGEPTDESSAGEPGKDPRREARERQEKIVDKARELEEKLKKLETASDLAKLRMTKAAETAEKASGALSRGSTKEATETAKTGAAQLHELARQVKGELARDVAQELAMARDLADELAEREGQFGQMPSEEPGSGSEPGQPDQPSGQGEKGEKSERKGQSGQEPGEEPGAGREPGRPDQPSGQGEKGEKGEGRSGQSPGADPEPRRPDQPSGQGEKGEKGDEGSPDKDGQGTSGSGGRGRGGRSGWDALTDAEQIERLEEAAKTLEHWLKDASLRAEGATSDRIREMIEQSEVTRIVERTERVGALYLGGQKPEARRDAKDLARILEVLARQLDVLHRGIVAPELAALVEFDNRLAELTTRLKDVKTDADLKEWGGMATALIRDLEKAGLTNAATALTAALNTFVWRRDGGPYDLAVVNGLGNVLSGVTRQIQDKIQDLILKDMVSARDEATPPEFRELVERYFEVLSGGGAGK